MKTFLVILVALCILSVPVSNTQAQTVTFSQEEVQSILKLLDELRAKFAGKKMQTSTAAGVRIHCKLPKGGSQFGLASDGTYFYFMDKVNQTMYQMKKSDCSSLVKKNKKFNIMGSGMVFAGGYFYAIDGAQSLSSQPHQVSLHKYNTTFNLVGTYPLDIDGDKELSPLAIQGVTYQAATGRILFVTNGENDAVYSTSLTGGGVKKEMMSPYSASYGIAESKDSLFLAGDDVTVINKATDGRKTISLKDLGTNRYVTSLYFDEGTKTLFGIDNTSDQIFSVGVR